jgi:NAD(P)-dependent dehydrogenase (short-subunit alcohol dehydrogenase family)
MHFVLRVLVTLPTLYIFASSLFMLAGSALTRNVNVGFVGMVSMLGALLGVVVGGRVPRTLAVMLLIVAIAAFSITALYPIKEELQMVEVPDRPVILVTGGTKGIGAAFVREASSALSHVNPRIIVMARSLPSDGSVAPADFIRADFSSVASMTDVVAKVRATTDRLDMLVLNAGVGDLTTFGEPTSEGIPAMVAINHVSQAALYRGLSTLLEASPLNRLVFVSSMANANANATAVVQPLDAPLAELEDIYGLTKLLQVMYARSIARRSSTHVVTLHPGCIVTGIIDATVMSNPARLSKMLYGTEALAPIAKLIARLNQAIVELSWEHSSVGGQRVLWAALDRRVSSGDHVHNFGQLNVWTGAPASDPAACDTVFEHTEALVTRLTK